jgi:hypothetical protein
MFGSYKYTLPEPEAARWKKSTTRSDTDGGLASQALAGGKARGKPDMLGVVYPALPCATRCLAHVDAVMLGNG